MNRRIDRKRAKEILEYEVRLRESVGRREELKRKLTELEHRRRDIFWDVEHAMLETGIRHLRGILCVQDRERIHHG